MSLRKNMSDKFKDKYRIESTRKPNWDYSSSDWYFVTICTQNRICWFGGIYDKEMYLNEHGRMVDKWWQELFNKYRNIKLGDHVIMPNHLHGITTIDSVETGLRARLNPSGDAHTGASLDVNQIRDAHTGASLHEMVGWFKTMTTNEYIRNVKCHNWKPFTKQIWQSRYHDRMIRNEFEYSAKVEYILNNPVKWDEDQNNPKNLTKY